MKTYKVLIKAYVNSANAFQGYYIGIPSPLTAIGFAEHIKLEILKILKDNNYTEELNSLNIDKPEKSFDFITIKNTSYGFDGASFKISNSHERFSNYMKNAKTDTINPAIVDNRTFSSKFFVSFDINLHNDIKYLEKEDLEELINYCVSKSTFSGGKIFSHKDSVLVISTRNQEEIKKEIYNNLKENNTAWFIIEDFNEKSLEKFNEIEDFSTLNDLEKLMFITKKKKDKNFKFEYDSLTDGYYIATNLGYTYINKEKEPSDRFKYNYVFAEPILSIVRARSLDSYGKNKELNVFWNLKEFENKILTNGEKI